MSLQKPGFFERAASHFVPRHMPCLGTGRIRMIMVDKLSGRSLPTELPSTPQIQIYIQYRILQERIHLMAVRQRQLLVYQIIGVLHRKPSSGTEQVAHRYWSTITDLNMPKVVEKILGYLGRVDRMRIAMIRMIIGSS